MTMVIMDGFDHYGGPGEVKIDGKVVGYIDELSWGSSDLRIAQDADIKSIWIGDREITGTAHLEIKDYQELERLMGGYHHGTTTIDIETDSLGTDTTDRRWFVANQRDERYGNMNRAQRRKAMAQERRALRKFK